MKYLKSLFGFSSNQQKGIFLLLLLIVIAQSLYVILRYKNTRDLNSNTSDAISITYQNQLDSLIELNETKGETRHPFNPNFISDFKGYTLGMSVSEIDLLMAYRANDKWINSAEEFQDVTRISDSLLKSLSPYFKFPEWAAAKSTEKKEFKRNTKSANITPIDLNTATALQLREVPGIGELLSNRIVKYRNTFEGGFFNSIQLTDIYGLKPDVIKRLLKRFPLLTPKKIKAINLNTATVEDLVTIQYIDYDLAYAIIEERTLRDGFNNLEELNLVKQFPKSKFNIISLYLLPIK